jgi:hypothetical protein
MNEWNPLETQLRCWTPRRPSAKLKSRAFLRAATAPQHQAVIWNWLAPATGCLLLLFFTFSDQGNGWSRLAGSNPGPIVAITLSNQSLAAYFPGSFPNEQNAMPADTFEWTNTSRSSSSIPSFPLSKTNYLDRR